MKKVTLKGSPIETIGNLPEIGSKAKDFELINSKLDTLSLKDFEGKKLVLNVFPSIDTATCAKSVKRFNEEVSTLENTMVLCISSDLPFAQARFCAAEGLKNVITLSDYATSQFGKDYGLEITSGKLFNLHSRAIIVIDSERTVTYTEQVPEIINEPNYNEALNAIKNSK